MVPAVLQTGMCPECGSSPSVEGGSQPREESRVCWDYRDKFVSYVYKLPIQIIFGFVFVPSKLSLELWQKFVCYLGRVVFSAGASVSLL